MTGACDRHCNQSSVVNQNARTESKCIDVVGRKIIKVCGKNCLMISQHGIRCRDIAISWNIAMAITSLSFICEVDAPDRPLIRTAAAALLMLKDRPIIRTAAAALLVLNLQHYHSTTSSRFINIGGCMGGESGILQNPTHQNFEQDKSKT